MRRNCYGASSSFKKERNHRNGFPHIRESLSEDLENYAIYKQTNQIPKSKMGKSRFFAVLNILKLMVK
jgi:hypothetical protein